MEVDVLSDFQFTTALASMVVESPLDRAGRLANI